MRLRTRPHLAAAAAILSAGAAQAATRARSSDAVARVTVVPEDRSDITVEVIAPNPKLPLHRLARRASATIIDGDLDRRIRNCNGGGRRHRAPRARRGRRVAARRCPRS